MVLRYALLLWLPLWSLCGVAAGAAELLYFGATWCQPCRAMQPTIGQLAEAGYPVRKLDIDKHADLAKRFSVTAVPTSLWIDSGGTVLGRIDGLASKQQLLTLMGSAGRPNSAQAAPPQGHAGHARGGVAGPVADHGSRFPRMDRTSFGAVPQVSADQRGNATHRAASDAPPTPTIKLIRSLPPVQARAVSATVRLRVEDQGSHSFGTGTVIDVHGDEALVLTCAHIFRESGASTRIIIDRFDLPAGRPTTGSLISEDIDLDVALVSMKLRQPIAIVPLADRMYRPGRGEPIFSVGCNRGAPPTLMQGRINDVDKYLGAPNLTASGEPVIGRSGGGLFNAAGQLVGVCNAADPEYQEGLYAALPRVCYELDRNGLDYVHTKQHQQKLQALGFRAGPGGVSQDSQDPRANVAAASGRDLFPAITDPRVAPAGAFGDVATTSAPSAGSGSGATAASAAFSGSPGSVQQDELTCVLRDKDGRQQRVFIIKSPSPTLLEYLQRESK